eukprot:CAMPEP_0202693682 /NCGR_PEP_ID=MMETSP1385-20130828/7722_1 /ASSEMBLY_ACC=CAM_ASM_000861 /TAXON_ID=933848 /ORGANISM="Elphidium margaritaceum" /LENGTH=184 /DNA_ID=CAMNT_0049349395 /DNA_START=78 /DNA_END=632 /DNA_ORIENTATION=-
MLSRLSYRTVLCTKSPFISVLSARSFSTLDEKGADRIEDRLAGLMKTDAEIDAELKTHFDDEGSYKPPHMSSFPSMTRRDVMMNVRIPPLGIEPPPFGEDQIREITEKTTLTRENIEWTRKHWLDQEIKPDQKEHAKLAYDMLEMYKKGVSYATINLWIDYYSGADIPGNKDAIYNRSWARIDS